MTYLQKKKLAFMGIVSRVKGFVRTVMGVLPLTLEGCVDEESIIDYKIYGQSVQDGEPTPDNPIEVESVGEKTNNLFDIDSISGLASFNSQLNGSYNILDGIIQSKFGMYGASTFFQCNVKTLAAGQYVLRFDVSYEGTVYYGLGFTDKTRIYAFTRNVSSSEWTTISYEFELTEDRDIFGIQLQGAGNAENFKDVKCYLKNIMLCKKSDDTGVYEPYGKYKIPITVSGGNLLSPYGWISGVFNGGFVPSEEYNYVVEEAINYVECTFKSTYRAIASNMIKVSEIQKIGFKVNKNNENAVAVVMQFYDIDGNRVAYKVMTDDYMTPDKEYIIYKKGDFFQSNSDKVNGYGIKSNFIYMRLFLISRQKISGLRIYDFYASKDGDANYEPYHEPITTNIYLDEPLRKVGDYADYIDFENGKVVRNIKAKDFTGDEKWSLQSINSYGIANFYYADAVRNKEMHILANRFPTQRTVIADTTTDGIFCVNAAIYVRLNSSIVSTVTDFENWLSENNTDVIYALKTPTEQPISLPTIPTFKGTSIVSADTKIQPSNAEIKYYSNVKE